MAGILRSIAREVKRNPQHRIQALRTIGKYGVEQVNLALAKVMADRRTR